MATAFSHAFVALALGAAFRPGGPALSRSWKLWMPAMICSAGPDLDIGLHAFGVQYGDLWGHRGLTHSLLFASVLAIVVVSWLYRRAAPWGTRRWWGLVAFFFAITASHGFIDAFTDGGLGIAFLSPFDTTRYFMPWHPLRVPQFGLASLFTAYGAEVLLSEFLWIWLPVGAVAGGIVMIRRRGFTTETRGSRR